MKFTAQEEYGLRCLLRIAQSESGSLTIPEISEAEGLSVPYVAKLLRILRRSGFLKSVRGQAGGYKLAHPADRVVIGDVLAALGGRLYEPAFCSIHRGLGETCCNSIDCSIRSLWRALQGAVDRVLSKTTLKDMVRNEQEMTSFIYQLGPAAQGGVTSATTSAG